MDEIVVVYADVLFLIDFTMDFLCLYVTCALMSVPAKLWRVVTAAAIGGIYSVLLQYLPETNFLLLLPLHIAVSFLLVFVSCGKSQFRRLAARVTVFFLTSAFVGGIVTALFSLRGGSERVNGGMAYAEISPLFLFAVAAFSVAASYVYGLVCRKRLSAQKAHAVVRYGGKTVSLVLLADTGCHVVDPMTGKAVIIVSHRVFGNDKPEMNRVIPIKSAGGSKILEGFRPDEVKVNGVNVDAVIASDDGSDAYSGCDGLIPIILMR